MAGMNKAIFGACLLLGFVLSSAFAQHSRNKICASRSAVDSCAQLGRNNSTLVCNENLHVVDCMINIDSNSSHIGRINGHEALLGASLLTSNVVVIGEILSSHPPLETVVILRNNVPNVAHELKGKRLCHPGFKHDETVSPLLLQEFETKILDDINGHLCDHKDLTQLERNIKALSEFFGPSCRPGPWTQNVDFDKTLQQKYSNLRALCGQNDYVSPFKDTLQQCLLNNRGDIAVTSLLEAQNFFGNSTTASIRTEYKYLCKDFTTSDSFSACTWTKELPSLLIARAESADRMRDFINSKLAYKTQNSSQTQDKTETALTTILNLRKREFINLFRGQYPTLTDYVRSKREIPHIQKIKKCDSSFKWCTHSDQEQSKCLWFSQAALNRAILPAVECQRSNSNDELSCLDGVAKGMSDVMVVSSDLAYIRLKKNVTNLAFPETDSRNISTILLVKREDNSEIRNLADLRSKRSCFPRYGGKEMLAFVDTLRQNKIESISATCDPGEVVTDFVGDSCLPGVRLKLIFEATSERVNFDKLCAQCVPINQTATHSYCNADAINKYYGDLGSLQCLQDGLADFAVISKPNELQNPQQYRVLCRNGQLAANPGLEVNAECALNTVISSEVVFAHGNPKKHDIIVALYEYERWFGEDPHKPFQLFNSFNNTKDLLFKDSTPGLIFDDNNEYVKNYKELLDRCEKCVQGSSSFAVTSSLICTLITVAISVFF